jgi:hypothetical protein
VEVTSLDGVMYGVLLYRGVTADNRGTSNALWAIWRNDWREAVDAYVAAHEAGTISLLRGAASIILYNGCHELECTMPFPPLPERIDGVPIAATSPSAPRNIPRRGMLIRVEDPEMPSPFCIVYHVGVDNSNGPVLPLGAGQAVWGMWGHSREEVVERFNANALAHMTWNPVQRYTTMDVYDIPQERLTRFPSESAPVENNVLLRHPRRGELIHVIPEILNPYCVVCHIGRNAMGSPIPDARTGELVVWGYWSDTAERALEVARHLSYDRFGHNTISRYTTLQYDCPSEVPIQVAHNFPPRNATVDGPTQISGTISDDPDARRLLRRAAEE